MANITRAPLLSVLILMLASPAAGQRTRPGWIGISLDIPGVGRLVDDDGPRVFIADVRRGSPAEEAGLRVGDRLVAIGDLRTAEDFRSLPERLRLQVGQRVRVRVDRDGRRLEVVLRAAEWPDDMRSRTVMLNMDPDSLVETMMRAMDSLRVQLIQVRGSSRDRTAASALNRSGTIRGARSSAVGAPFEFFVFRNEEHDSLRQAMEELNRLTADLRRQEERRVEELRRAFAGLGDIDETDQELLTVRTSLEQLERESARLRAAMSEAARATAGLDYTVRRGRSAEGNRWPPLPDAEPDPEPTSAFRPLTPYLVGSNMVAGAQVIDLRPELAQYFDVGGGVLVIDVASGTPADIAGMVPGDVITRIDQVRVGSVEELRLGVSRSGASLPLSLVRHGSTLEVLLRLR